MTRHTSGENKINTERLSFTSDALESDEQDRRIPERTAD
jgi:hypothetical protein